MGSNIDSQLPRTPKIPPNFTDQSGTGKLSPGGSNINKPGTNPAKSVEHLKQAPSMPPNNLDKI